MLESFGPNYNIEFNLAQDKLISIFELTLWHDLRNESLANTRQTITTILPDTMVDFVNIISEIEKSRQS